MVVGEVMGLVVEVEVVVGAEESDLIRHASGDVAAEFDEAGGFEFAPDAGLVAEEEGGFAVPALELLEDGAVEVFVGAGVRDDEFVETEAIVHHGAFDGGDVFEVLDGGTVEAGAEFFVGGALHGGGVVPDGDDAKAGAFEVGFGEAGVGFHAGRIGEVKADGGAGFGECVVGHEVAHSRGAGDEAIVGGGGGVVVVEESGTDIDEAGGNGPVEREFATNFCALIPVTTHAALNILNVIAIADEEGDVGFVFERRHFGDGRNLDVVVHAGVDGGIEVVIGSECADAELGGGGDAGAFGGIPSEGDSIASFHGAIKFAEEVAFGRDSGIEPKDASTDCSGEVAGVMEISAAIGGAGAKDEAFGALLPIIGVEVFVDFERGGEGEFAEVNEGFEIDFVLASLSGDFRGHGQGAAQSCDGSGEVAVVGAEGGIVKDDSLDFGGVLGEEIVFVLAGVGGGEGEVDIGGFEPGVAAFIGARVEEENAGLGAVDLALEGGEGDLLVAGEGLDFDGIERGRRGKMGQGLASGP